MAREDRDRVDPVELIDELAPGDQQAILEEVAERLGYQDSANAEIELTEEAVGELRDRFVEERVSDDHEAVGELLTLALLTKTQSALAEQDGSAEELEFELEVHVEPVADPENDRHCLRFGIVNGIYNRPLYWKTCIISGIF
jgi:hypothetical protein